MENLMLHRSSHMDGNDLTGHGIWHNLFFYDSLMRLPRPPSPSLDRFPLDSYNGVVSAWISIWFDHKSYERRYMFSHFVFDLFELPIYAVVRGAGVRWSFMHGLCVIECLFAPSLATNLPPLDSFLLTECTIIFLFWFIAVCNQFSRGVFSMLGAVSPESFDTLHSYSNTFQMPFVTPWFPEKVSYIENWFFSLWTY